MLRKYSTASEPPLFKTLLFECALFRRKEGSETTSTMANPFRHVEPQLLHFEFYMISNMSSALKAAVKGKTRSIFTPRLPAARGFPLCKTDAGLAGYDPARAEKDEKFLLYPSSFLLGLTPSFQKKLQYVLMNFWLYQFPIVALTNYRNVLVYHNADYYLTVL